ncbi:hypothetical protein [Streptomyces rugosispiralis]|uniref:Uncharacterized protein n=1 Tax=Streptomyces rugosispiralis TaxID=2967341 RepID=A0ABT1V494_9ACTN|nr:hypothetical protein [Streptomyces rugosispiralis]MCQ8191833.1 hypothetical protein [Streptomyces rugosispiralis]
MRNSIVRTLATGAAAAVLAGGAAVAAPGAAFATPTASVTHVKADVPRNGATPSPTPSPTMKGKHCKDVKAHTKTVTHHGKTYKVWISAHRVCYTPK